MPRHLIPRVASSHSVYALFSCHTSLEHLFPLAALRVGLITSPSTSTRFPQSVPPTAPPTTAPVLRPPHAAPLPPAPTPSLIPVASTPTPQAASNAVSPCFGTLCHWDQVGVLCGCALASPGGAPLPKRRSRWPLSRSNLTILHAPSTLYFPETINETGLRFAFNGWSRLPSPRLPWSPSKWSMQFPRLHRPPWFKTSTSIHLAAVPAHHRGDQSDSQPPSPSFDPVESLLGALTSPLPALSVSPKGHSSEHASMGLPIFSPWSLSRDTPHCIPFQPHSRHSSI